MLHIEELHKAEIFFSLWNVLIDSKVATGKRTAWLIVFIYLSPTPHYFFMQLQEISGINLLTTTCVQKAWPLPNRTEVEGCEEQGGLTRLKLECHYSDLVQQRCFCCHFTFVDNLSHRDATDWNNAMCFTYQNCQGFRLKRLHRHWQHLYWQVKPQRIDMVF